MNDELIAEYLNAALGDPDPDVFRRGQTYREGARHERHRRRVGAGP